MGWSRRVTAGAIVATLLAATAVVPALSASAASPPVNDGGVIANAVPAKFTPNVVDGTIKAMVQVGTRMVVGGTFTQVTPTAGAGSGTTVTRNFIFAFNATTGALDTGFVPVVDGEVDAIVPTADGTGVYVGGTFLNAGGVSARLAEFNLTTGARVTTFTPTLNGQINAMAMVGSRLFVAGTFTVVRGFAHIGLASVNPTTGGIDPYLTVDLTGNHNCGRVAGAACARVGATDIAVSPDGSRMIVDGNFINAADTVNTTGYARDQIASILLGPTSATVDPNWNSLAYINACSSASFDSYVRSIGWSPDGSYFVVAATGGYPNNSLKDCDTASRFDASSTGQNVVPAWIDFTGKDSLYSVAVTSDAVYVGGHQRWLNNPFGADNAQRGAVPRPGLAALDPANGVPLSWNPGRNPRGHGAEVVYATNAGVWVGSDTDWIGNFHYKHQKIAFFPFAGGTPATGNNAGDPRTVFVAGANNANNFSANTFDPTTGTGGTSGTQPSTGGSTNWSTVQGAFVLNGRIWFGQGGQLFYMTWNGANTFGTPQLVDPYNDPYWDPVVNGSPPTGTTYTGKVTDFYAELPSVTGMFYANRTIYYTLSGQKGLFSRAFSPDTASSSVANQSTGGIISSIKNTIVPNTGGLVDFSNASGMFVANGSLWYSTKADGKLHKAPWSGTNVTGASTVDASASNNWAGKAVFVSPVAPPVPPTASFTSSCPNATCFFDASASTAPGSTITSYAWDFGDGTNGSGVKPSHTYTSIGDKTVKLTVTNAQNATTSVTNTAHVTTLTSNGIAFVAQANTNGNATSEALTVPSAVVAGEGLVLIATGATTTALTGPAGWTLIGSKTGGTAIVTTAWQKVATAGDANSSVSVGFPSGVHGTVQLLAYSGTNGSAPVAASASSAAQVTGTSYTTPASNVPVAGDVVLSYWAAKNSAVTAWTVPGTTRSVANGSGSGRVNSVATDGGASGTGATGGLTGTVDGSSGAFAAWTIVLDSTGGTPPPPANPTANFTATCNLLVCHFDASSSTPGGAAITDYAWDFADPSPDPGTDAVTQDHTFAAGGTYQVKLTVTDALTHTGTKTVPVSVTATAPAVAFVAQASTNGNAMTETLTVPNTVAAGNALVLIATGATPSALSAPAGWNSLGTSTGGTAVTTTAWSKVATAGDPGSTVTVTFPGVVHGTVQVLAYSGTNATTPVVVSAQKATQVTANTYTTPTSNVPIAGDVVISYWAAKNSATTPAWTWTAVPTTLQSQADGTGGGHINSIATDGGAAPAGAAGGLTATGNQNGGAFAAWTIVVGP
jgi:PKD repeat protein